MAGQIVLFWKKLLYNASSRLRYFVQFLYYALERKNLCNRMLRKTQYNNRCFVYAILCSLRSFVKMIFNLCFKRYCKERHKQSNAWKLQDLISSKCVLILLIAFKLNFACADTIEELNSKALEIIKNITCETSGVGDLLRSEFSHTCIPAPFFDAVIANILSPGLYLSAVLKLKINDEELFPNACKKENRIDPHDPKMSFAFCSNVKLAVSAAEAVVSGSINMIADLAIGKNIADAINDNFNIDRVDYHEIFTDQKPDDSGVMWDVPLPLPWKVVKYRDQLCVATLGIAGWMNVGCRYMQEPYPQSIYELNPGLRGIINCSSTQESCYERAKKNAANMTAISGPIVNCAREMMIRLLVNPSYCGEEGQTVTTIVSSSENIFHKFQKNMYRAVSAFLTLYVIIVGFNIILNRQLPQKGEIILYILKIVLVIYFSVGINTNHQVHGFDGMTEWIFPIMIDGTAAIASWVLNASDSQLCKFSSTDYSAALQGYHNLYSIWDALDCRVLHYLGLNFMSDTENSSKYLNFSIPPYLLLLIPAIITGSVQLIMLAISYPLMVISVAAYFVNSFVISLIMIVILGVMAPIFVPMVLFNFTKGYFTAWFKLMLSFTLQPTVVATFLIVMFSVYDHSFYGECKYNSFKLTEADGTMKKVFFINTNKADYTNQEFNSCLSSLGGLLNFPLAVAINTTLAAAGALEIPLAQGSYAYELNVNPFNGIEIKDYFKDISFLSSLTEEKGIFFTGFTVVFEFIRDLVFSMFSGCVILYLMYHFSEQLSEFVADISESVSTGSASIGAQDISKKVNSAGGQIGGGGKGGG